MADDDAQRKMFDAVAEALEGWQVLLDAFEGYVSRTKAMGWSDEQARAIVLPQVIATVKAMGQPPAV